MSEPTYTLTLTDAERRTIAHSFGLLVEKLTNARIQLEESPTGGTAQARAVLAPPQNPPSPSPAAASRPTPTEPRDRWARDRKGNEVANPEGCETIDVHLWKTEQKEKYLKVTWQTNAQGYADANCFDEKLWPWLIKQAGQRTRLYILRAKGGKYLNVVGVRA